MIMLFSGLWGKGTIRHGAIIRIPTCIIGLIVVNNNSTTSLDQFIVRIMMLFDKYVRFEGEYRVNII